jgi:hypothetical protein
MTLKIPRDGLKARTILMAAATLVISLAYFSTQFSYVMKSPLIANNFLAVFIMLFTSVTLYFWGSNQERN